MVTFILWFCIPDPSESLTLCALAQTHLGESGSTLLQFEKAGKQVVSLPSFYNEETEVQRKSQREERLKTFTWDFPGGAVVKNPPANAGTRVRTLVREDPTCRGATKPVCHNY